MTDNDNVVRFPVKRATSGRVCCPPLNIYFPQLYRIVQTVTRAQLDAEGLAGEEPIDGMIHYTISEEQNYTGTITSEVVRTIPDKGEDSIVIRHHHTLNEAAAYLDALRDVLGAEMVEPICRTREGLFTMARRPTEASWPGPMIFYVAIHPANNPIGIEDWQIATAPDGTVTEGEYL